MSLPKQVEQQNSPDLDRLNENSIPKGSKTSSEDVVEEITTVTLQETSIPKGS